MTFRLDSPSVLVPVVTLHLQQSVVVAVTQRAHLYRERLPCWIQGVLYNFSFVNYCESKITPRIGVVLRSRTLVSARHLRPVLVAAVEEQEGVGLAEEVLLVELLAAPLHRHFLLR